MTVFSCSSLRLHQRWAVGIPGRDWLFHLADCEPLEVIFSDDLTYGEVLALYPAAVAAMPWQETTAAPLPEPEPAPYDPFPVLPTCNECQNLAGPGRDDFKRCHAAVRGELARVASRNYSPQVSARKRCEGYKPKPGDPDQRNGRERWPWLFETAGK